MTQGLDRRSFIKRGAAAAAAASLVGAGSGPSFAQEQTLKVGFVGPLTGPLAPWGLPGLWGLEIWAEQINAAGGIRVGNQSYKIEFLPYDDEFLPEKSLPGVKKLVLEDGVQFLIMVGGAPARAVQPFLTKQEIMSTTVLASDTSPDSPYLLAAMEADPFYNGTGLAWRHQQNPEIKRVAICTQNDEIGVNSIATYRATCEIENMEIVEEKLFGFDVYDMAPIMSSMLAAKPDVLCFDTSYPDYVNLLCEQAFLQGWRGPIVGSTLDNYDQIMTKTSKEFLEGYTFQWPDFDDPRLQENDINFPDAAGFYRTYESLHPGTWTAVPWTFPAIFDQWRAGAEAAGSIESMAVFEALKSMDEIPHPFGPAKWWGKAFYGIDNVAFGRWPIVEMHDGKAEIVAMPDVHSWLVEHEDVFKRVFESYQLI